MALWPRRRCSRMATSGFGMPQDDGCSSTAQVCDAKRQYNERRRAAKPFPACISTRAHLARLAKRYSRLRTEPRRIAPISVGRGGTLKTGNTPPAPRGRAGKTTCHSSYSNNSHIQTRAGSVLRSTVPCSSRSSLTFILEQYRFGVRALDIDALGKIGKSCCRTEVALRSQR